MGNAFTVKPAHLKLLRHANVGWNGMEFGAPSIDGKRPFGSSNVYDDMVRILGLEQHADSHEVLDMLERVYGELKTVLQIALATGRFEPGEYRQEREYDQRSWRKVA